VRAIAGLAEGRDLWSVPWPCLHEFIGIVTRPRIYDPPSTLSEAIDQADVWMRSPSVTVIAEPDDHWIHLRSILLASHTIGPRVHDARIAALCIQHGVRELWTADRDFNRFPQLKTVNPLMRRDG
jgi:predicted nucleic acid-binding protein